MQDSQEEEEKQLPGRHEEAAGDRDGDQQLQDQEGKEAHAESLTDHSRYTRCLISTQTSQTDTKITWFMLHCAYKRNQSLIRLQHFVCAGLKVKSRTPCEFDCYLMEID